MITIFFSTLCYSIKITISMATRDRHFQSLMLFSSSSRSKCFLLKYIQQGCKRKRSYDVDECATTEQHTYNFIFSEKSIELNLKVKDNASTVILEFVIPLSPDFFFKNYNNKVLGDFFLLSTLISIPTTISPQVEMY